MAIPDENSEHHISSPAVLPVDTQNQNGNIGHGPTNTDSLVPKIGATENASVDGAATSAAQEETATESATVDQAKHKHDRPVWRGKVEFLLSAVGFAVGLGNVWRFPHLCYRHGGGAFLVPYLIMLLFMGLPLFFLELAFGQYASLGPLTIWRVCPLFTGVGYAMCAISFLVSIYYNVLIGYTLFYFFSSFTSPLPWAHCHNYWNTPACSLNRHAVDRNLTTLNNLTQTSTESIITESNLGADSSDHNVSAQLRSPAQEYWEYRVLGLTDTTDISNVGGLRWQVTLCLLLAWVIVFLCIKKGIKSSGKVVYVTATLPYLMLFILFVVTISREGAGTGIIYYLKPDFHKMGETIVWKEAAVQILYSLGVGSGALLTMGSFNKFKNNCQRDAMIVALVNCGTSIFAGFVIFAILGHMAFTAGVDVSVVAEKAGPGLAFVVYPEGIAMLPGAPFWSICFFFMLFTLGLDSQFATMECLMTGIIDECPKLYRHKTLVTAGMCTLMFFLGLPCVTEGGMYVIDLFDKFSTAFPLLFTVLFEVIIINWIYGFKRFGSDIEHMIGFRPNYYWIGCWVGVTPCVIMFILVFSCIQYDGITLENGYKYPGWAEAIGWLLSLTSLLMIPVWMIIKLVRCIGSWQNLMWVLRGPAEFSSLHLETLVTPSHEWGPAMQKDRVGRDTQIYGRMDEQTTDVSLPNVLFKEETCIISDTYGGDSYI